MGADHRVQPHLGVSAATYDEQIRRFIPGYDEMIATAIRWLSGHLPPGGLVIDLGAGTGALARAILDALPSARVRLVDVDPTMLEAASLRCASHAGRVELRKATFAEGLAPCSAVVASLALHHVADVAEKRALYRSIHGALKPGGLLVVADATAHPDGRERKRLFAEWSSGMQRHGISAAEAEGHFAQWAREDFYRPLGDELQAIGEAGFTRPECFWKLGAITVYGGFKD